MSTLRKRIGERIKELRRTRGLTQEQLGERARVGYKFIGDVERGQANPTVEWLDAVARGLEVSLRDLIVEDDPPRTPARSLSGHDYSAVREARDSLEAIIRRYNDTDDKKPSAAYVKRRRPRAKRK